jgi:hypothetical protein
MTAKPILPAVTLLFVLGLGLPVRPTGLLQEKANTGAIKGAVEDKSGKPVANVKVRAISRQTNQMKGEVITDEHGKFALPELPADRYALVFYSPNYEQAVIRSVEVKAGRETELEKPIQLQPAEQSAVLRGATFDANGYLLPGVRVVLERIPIENEKFKPLKTEQVSNSSGEFAFRLPGEMARYRLTATTSGYEPEIQDVDVGGAERRNVSIQMKTKKK